MAPRAVILGCAGPRLTAAERAFFARVRPWGFILFARNIETAEQVRALAADLREAAGHAAPVMIDQEGGRVQRLRPPLATGWDDALPFVEALAPEARAEAMRLRCRVIAAELRDLGIDVNCAPVADMPRADTHGIILGRCCGREPAEVARLGRAAAEGLLEGGVLPVMKHIPGHGAATVDSHAGLPVVALDRETLEATDFAPFRALSDLPLAMTAHVVYPAIDPERPATLSPGVVRVIREDIGFGGLLMTDDLSMGALTGAMATRAAGALSAGCDVVLHCNGEMDEMAAVAEAAPVLSGRSLARAEAALALRVPAGGFDVAAALSRLAALKREMAHA